MNRIYFATSGIMLTDECIKSASMSLQNAMVAETLTADTMTFRSIDKARVNNVWQDRIPVELLNYGDQIQFAPSEDQNDLRRFYLRSYKRVGEGEWEFEACSAVGMLGFMEHKGGIYNGETVEQVIKGDYANGIKPLIPWREGSHTVNIYPVFIDQDVASVQLYGWLPIASSRDNLVQILFSCGASILKVEDGPNRGYMRIAFNEPTSADVVLTKDIVSMSGKAANYVSPATSVTVVEHTFTASSETVDTILFDNRSSLSANNYYVEFSGPYHSLTPYGLTVTESGANYAIISGTGYLTGKEYTHGQRKVTESTNVVGEPNEKMVTNCTLIGPLNIDNVVARAKSYYSLARFDRLVAHTHQVKPGQLVSYPDPVDTSQTKYGYVTNVEANIGETMTETITIAANWKPNHLGNSFNTSIAITEDNIVDGKWVVPYWCENEPARVVLFGGGTGGQGSMDGGASAQTYYEKDEWYLIMGGSGSVGEFSGAGYVPDWEDPDNVLCKGGEGGEGGKPGKILSIPLTLGVAGTEYPITLGTGGSGGSAGGTAGSDGTDTTFTDGGITYSSASGSVGNDGGYIDMITGSIYATKGEDGAKGGNGGGAGEYKYTATPVTKQNIGGQYYDEYFVRHDKGGEDGQSVDTSLGGKGSEYREFWNNTYTKYCYGSGGGGASKDNPGTDASLPTATSYSDGASAYKTKAGDGGSAVTPTANTLASGGHGANGGGGAGARGAYIRVKDADETQAGFELGAAGTPGSGSAGGDGGNGLVIIYTKDNRVLSYITITTPPTKTQYTAGETLDLSGMVVTATYADGTTEDVTAYCTASPADGEELTEDGDVTVIITYTHLDLTLQVEQQITVS